MILEVKVFFDMVINIVFYVVKDFEGCVCVIIDSVLDFDYVVGEICIQFVDEVIVYICVNNLWVDWIFEIYVYVDYFLVVFYL